MDHFDLAVIGTGSGNSLVTPDFDDKRVAVIESGIFGGTCLNVGCIPTKMFVYAADIAENVRRASRYGVDARLDGVRWDEIRDRVFGRIDPISAAGRVYRVEGWNTTAFLGRARFTGPRSLHVDLPDGSTAELEADQVVIAAGSDPVVPPVIAESGVRVHTSDTVMRMEELPARMLIVGGGYIAAEFAHIFGALGVEVTLAVRGPQLLRELDGEISRRFTAHAREEWDVRLQTQVSALRRWGDEVRVDLDDGTTLDVGEVLVATGRAPNTPHLDLPCAGVGMHLDGRVRVDEYGRTGVPGVWALGDVSSPYQLKHVANQEARVVAHNLVHPEDLCALDHRFVPSAVFTCPQIASVGDTEEQLRSAGVDYVAKVQAYGDTAYGWAMEDKSGVCKVLAERSTGRLLGVHIMGYQASMLIQPAVQAMSFGQDAQSVARGQYWIHPALTEVLENALLGLPL